MTMLVYLWDSKKIFPDEKIDLTRDTDSDQTLLLLRSTNIDEANKHNDKAYQPFTYSIGIHVYIYG